MNVMLFLGSGISRPSWEHSGVSTDIPDLAGITQSVLRGSWKRQGEIFVLRPTAEPSCEIAERIQRFLQRLTTRVSSYYNDYRGDVNYEDLFYLSDQLRSTLLNPAVQSFVEEMRLTSEDLYFRPNVGHALIDFDDLCKKACDFIQCVVWERLRQSPTLCGMDLILGLARLATAGAEIKRLTICTLNHDLLLERLLDGIDYEDGFGNPKNGDFFDPDRFREPISFRLLKLHGSINWFRHQRREGEHYSEHYSKVRFETLPHKSDVRWIPDDIPRILTGSYNKVEAYGTDIIKEVMHIFHSELGQHQLIVMSGYGWGDYAINQRLCEWLGRAKSHRIVLLHKTKPISSLNSGHVIRFQYRRLIRLRKLVVMHKWLQHTDWSEIVGRIAREDQLPARPAPNPLDFLDDWIHRPSSAAPIIST